MKKSFFSMGLMFVAALTLTTNCAKEEAAPEEAVKPVVKEAVPFEFTVSSIGTKTSTEDASTISWVANDNVNVFHAETGSADYSSNDEFTITSENLAAGTFTGTLQDGALDEEKSYDWYVLYPYSSYIETPANTSKGYTAIGSADIDTPQVQAGYDSRAHLAGQYFPLYGKATSVAANEKPSITLNQALAVIKVHVTNAKATPLTVTTVAFTAPQNIVGTYYINFTGTTPTYTSSGSSHVSKTANLSVTGGTALAQNKTADFYIAFKPFTAAVGDKISIAVNGEVKTLTISGSAVEFQPGKVKTLNYSFDADPIIYSTEFNYAIDGSDYKNADAHIGIDEGGQTSWGLTYGNWYSSKSAQFRVYNSGGGNGTLDQRFDCSHISYFTFDAKVNNESTSLSLIPSYSTDKGNTWTTIGEPIAITKDETKFKVTMPSDMDRARIKLVVSGERPSSGNTQLTVDNLKLYGSGAILADPYIVASNVTDVPVIGGAGLTLTYTVHNFSGVDDVTAAGDGTVIATSAVVDPAGTVTYTVNPNYGTSTRNGSITLTSDGEGVDKVVTVSQLGETFSVSNTTVTIPNDKTSASFTITTPTLGWTASASAADGMNLTITGDSSGDGSASAQTITVNSTTAAAGEEQTLGTIVVYRNGNESDSQKKTITIKKASSGPTSSYTKVTSLTDNAQYLLVNISAAKVATGTVTSKTLQSVAVTISGGTTITGSDTIDGYAMTVTALDGDDDGFYTLKFGSKYLQYVTSTTVGLSDTATSDNEKWSISIDGEGVATILSKASDTRFIGWNNSNGWKAYSTNNISTYPRPYLFKKD